MNRTWVEISRRRLEGNVAAIRQRLQAGTDFMAVVKANAYGHGVGPVARTLLDCGVRRFAVACLKEAVELRQWVSDCPILVLGGCMEGEEDAFRHLDLTAAIFDERPFPEDVKVEVEVDTGMTRLGVPWTRAAEFVRNCRLNVTGVYSHFSSAESDPGFSLLQLKRFLDVTEDLPYPRHICNSGSLNLKSSHLDMVRVGLAIYGVRPSPDIDYVRPALRWKTRIIAVNEVPAGRVVGYGGTYSTHRPTRIGVLPVGYGDGYNRGLSNRGHVRIAGRSAPIVGRVSMDLTCVDLSSFPEARPGDEATILENDNDSPISANALARALSTIPYEVLTSIGRRVERVVVEEKVPELR